MRGSSETVGADGHAWWVGCHNRSAGRLGPLSFINYAFHLWNGPKAIDPSSLGGQKLVDLGGGHHDVHEARLTSQSTSLWVTLLI